MRVYEHPTRSGALAGMMNVEARAAASDKPIVDYIGSDASEDRWGSIIDPLGWELDAYLKNPVVLWAHDYGSPPIGRALSVTKTKRSLTFRVEFATQHSSFAADIYGLIKSGFLPGVSVGFLPLASEPYDAKTVSDRYAEGLKFTKCELLELSVVPVPANRNALQNAYAKGRIRESTVIMAGRSFRSFLNGRDMFKMTPPRREWEPSPETLRRIEALMRRVT
jgi:uncharacterized protein